MVGPETVLTWLLYSCCECERKHGLPMGDGWIPVEWISAQSSSYCAMPSPTVILQNFMETWAPASEIDFGTRTGGVNDLGTSTDVSLYFTSTPIKGTAAVATTTGAAVTVAGSTTKAVITCTSGVGVCAGAPSSSGALDGSTTASGSAPAATLNSSAAGLRISGVLVAVIVGMLCLI